MGEPMTRSRQTTSDLWEVVTTARSIRRFTDGLPAAHVEDTPATPTIDTLVALLNEQHPRSDRPWTAGDTLKNVLLTLKHPDGTTEPLAIMLPKNDPEFKKLVDDEMRRLITSRDIYPIYDKWFHQPIPPGNTVLNLPVSYLLRDFWKYPTDQVPF